MKKYIAWLMMAVLVLLMPVGTAQAYNKMDMKYVESALSRMEGDWLDSSGKTVLAIHNGYINGCKVIAAFDFAGGSSDAQGDFVIREATGDRHIRIEWHTHGNEQDYLVVNDEQALHRTVNAYYESVDGVHLGMTSEALLAKWGEPTAVLSDEGYILDGNGRKLKQGWWYNDKGVVVTFAGRAVDRITLLGFGKARLDRSGLGCRSRADEFMAAYNLKYPENASSLYERPLYIGHGEYIWLTKGVMEITLSVYNN